MVANEVATASNMKESLAMALNLKRNRKKGTKIKPPPIPNSPAKMPDKTPNAKHIKNISIIVDFLGF